MVLVGLGDILKSADGPWGWIGYVYINSHEAKAKWAMHYHALDTVWSDG